jgi:hypothetical protein
MDIFELNTDIWLLFFDHISEKNYPILMLVCKKWYDIIKWRINTLENNSQYRKNADVVNNDAIYSMREIAHHLNFDFNQIPTKISTEQIINTNIFKLYVCSAELNNMYFMKIIARMVETELNLRLKCNVHLLIFDNLLSKNIINISAYLILLKYLDNVKKLRLLRSCSIMYNRPDIFKIIISSDKTITHYAGFDGIITLLQLNRNNFAEYLDL